MENSTYNRIISPAITGPQVAWSLIAFIVIYILMLEASSYYILKLMLMYKGIPAIKGEEQFYKHGIGASVVGASISGKRTTMFNFSSLVNLPLLWEY